MRYNILFSLPLAYILSSAVALSNPRRYQALSQRQPAFGSLNSLPSNHNDDRDGSSDFKHSRRDVLNKISYSIATAATATIFPSTSSPALATAQETSSTTATITTPLEYIPSLNAYVAHFYLFGERFGAIVDTGSPFLTVPSTCNKWAYKYSIFEAAIIPNGRGTVGMPIR